VKANLKDTYKLLATRQITGNMTGCNVTIIIQLQILIGTFTWKQRIIGLQLYCKILNQFWLANDLENLEK
jgi:hypothetical protein